MSSFRLQNYFTLQIDISFRCLCLWQHHGQCVRILTIGVHCSIQCINHWNLNGWVFIQSWVWLVISDIFGIVKVLWLFRWFPNCLVIEKMGKTQTQSKRQLNICCIYGDWRSKLKSEGLKLKENTLLLLDHDIRFFLYTYNMILHEELDFTVFISCCVICYCFLVLKK